jgi:hypothetical protein
MTKDNRDEPDFSPKFMPYPGIFATFEPKDGSKMLPLHFDNNQYFPDDPASRWILMLLVARNDLGVSIKLQAPFVFAPDSPDSERSLYRLSHQAYFWRLTMAQLAEVWGAFNRGAQSEVVIKAVCNDPKVKAAQATVVQLLSHRSGTLKPEDLMKRCRVVTQHYYDNEGDDWGNQLKSIPIAQPAALVPDSGFAVDVRYIVADEYIMSRLNMVGILNRELHSESLQDITAKMLALVDACIEAYVEARKKNSHGTTQ